VVAFPLAMAKANQILIEIFLACQLLCATSVSALTLVLSPAAAAADAANSIMQRIFPVQHPFAKLCSTSTKIY